MSGAKENGAMHGLTLLPVKKSQKGAYHWRCGFCGSHGFLPPEFNPEKHGYSYKQALDIANDAMQQGIPAVIV